MSLLDPFLPAQDIADAVLYEGYVLYPYRASSDKNRVRWQWGVLGPPGAHADGVGEDPTMTAMLLVVHDGGAAVRIRLRALRLVTRTVERLGEAGPIVVDAVTIDDETHVSFDDTEVVTVDHTVDIGSDAAEELVPVTLDAGSLTETVGTVDGAEHRISRRRAAIDATIRLSVETVDRDVSVLTVSVENITHWPGGDRDDANLRSLIGVHLLGAVEGGLFLSTTDPPDMHAEAVAACRGHRLWPALVGAARRSSLVLASPVILADQPEIAPESHGTFYDGLEIDEMLSLRVMTMTDEEKAEARATDARSAAIVDRVDAMGADDLASLHGAIRSLDVVDDLDVPTIVGDGTAADGTPRPWWDPGSDARFDPGTDGVVVAGEAVSRGSVVRLHPGKRADAHDLFYRERVATVAAVLHDVDGSIHVAVTVDDDPAADINDATGRYLYFDPGEIEPLGRRVER